MQFKQILFISRFFRERSPAASLVVYCVVSRPYFVIPIRFRWIPHLKIGFPLFYFIVDISSVLFYSSLRVFLTRQVITTQVVETSGVVNNIFHLLIKPYWLFNENTKDARDLIILLKSKEVNVIVITNQNYAHALAARRIASFSFVLTVIPTKLFRN